jgi:hypothetical protein
MVMDILRSIAPSFKKIAIVGLPCSGKTFLSEALELELPHYEVLHTDALIELGAEASLSRLQHLVRDPDKYQIVEGVLVYRLLRKGWRPNVILRCECDSATRADRYRQRGNLQGTDHLKQMNKSLIKIWNDYCDVRNTEVNKTPILFYDSD